MLIVYRNEPWRHIEIENALPDAAIADLCKRWPHDGWRELEHPDQLMDDGHYRRRQQPLVRCFPALGWLASDEFRNDLFRWLQADAIECWPQALLIDDAPGYWIRPHPDAVTKILTLQIYLPDDGEHPEMGTTLMREDGSEPHTLAFVPNYGYAFRVAPHTWHAVSPCAHRRKSLQVTWYDSPDPAVIYADR